MIKHNYIYNKIWSDYKYKHLTNESKLLFLYFLTSPHLNILGTYYLPISYMSCDTGINKEEINNSIKELLKKNIIKYDFENEIILINNFFKYNKEHLYNPSTLRSIPKLLLDLPESYLIYDCYNKLNDILDAEKIKIISNILLKSNILKKCKEMSILNYNEYFTDNNIKPSICLTNDNDNDNETNIKEPNTIDFELTELKEQTKEEKQNIKKEENKRKKKELENKYKNEFEIFYSSYPRQEHKTTARTNFIKILNNKNATYDDGTRITSSDLIECAKNYSSYCLAHNTITDYIKLASNFLGRDECYKDYLPKKNNYSKQLNSNVSITSEDNPYNTGTSFSKTTNNNCQEGLMNNG